MKSSTSPMFKNVPAGQITNVQKSVKLVTAELFVITKLGIQGAIYVQNPAIFADKSAKPLKIVMENAVFNMGMMIRRPTTVEVTIIANKSANFVMIFVQEINLTNIKSTFVTKNIVLLNVFCAKKNAARIVTIMRKTLRLLKLRCGMLKSRNTI